MEMDEKITIDPSQIQMGLPKVQGFVNGILQPSEKKPSIDVLSNAIRDKNVGLITEFVKVGGEIYNKHLQQALKGGDKDVLGALLGYANSNEVDNLIVAVRCDSEEMVKRHLEYHGSKRKSMAGKSILDNQDYLGKTALHLAVENQNLKIVQLLIAYGADVNIMSQRANPDSAMPVIQRSVKYREEFWAPVHLAASIGAKDIVEDLISNGADFQVKTNSGKTPFAIARQNEHFETAKYIMEQEESFFTNPDNMSYVMGADEDQPGKEKGNLNMKNLFTGDSESLKFARAVQIYFWKQVEDDIENIKKIKDPKHALFAQRFEYLKVEHLQMLKTWRNIIADIPFEDLIKIPEFVATELDACILYLPDGDSRLQKYLFGHELAGSELFGEDNFVLDRHLLAERSDDKHPLGIIKKENCRLLLDHPLVRFEMRQLWKDALCFYLPMLLIYLIYVVLMTVHMTIPEAVNETAIAIAPMLHINATCAHDEFSGSDTISVIIICLACIGMVKEILEIIRHKASYFYLGNGEVLRNLVDWFCYVGGFYIGLYPFTTDCFIKGDVAWQIGVVVVFAAWINFTLNIRIFPFLGIFVAMVELIFASFMSFCIVFGLFVFAFAVTFHLLFVFPKDEPDGFEHLGVAFVRAWVMMVGEINHDDVIDDAGKADYGWIIYVMFVCFLVLLVLILWNLLTGIAVSDVQELKEDSESRIIDMQIDYILDVHMGFFRRNYMQTFIFCLLCTIFSRLVKEDGNRNKDWEDGILHFQRDDYVVISQSSSFKFSLVQWLDHLLFGPLRKEYYFEKMESLCQAKENTFYLVPVFYDEEEERQKKETEWRNDCIKNFQMIQNELEALREEISGNAMSIPRIKL